LCSSNCSAIIAGYANNHTNSSKESFIGTGFDNCIDGSCRAGIITGCNNCITTSAHDSVILGGYSNSIVHACSFIAGCDITTTTTKTFYANNATITCHLQVGGTTTLNTTTGRIDATNDVVAYATSDRRLKENIKPIDSALCKVIGVSGNTFDWKELTKEEKLVIHGNEGPDVGVIAQEIEEVLPEAVTTRESGYKAVNYEKIVPLLIEAIKDLTNKVEKLETKINKK
jgi:hypothetical protein